METIQNEMRLKMSMKMNQNFNENENTTVQNLWNTAEAVLGGKDTAIQVSHKKLEETGRYTS